MGVTQQRSDVHIPEVDHFRRRRVLKCGRPLLLNFHGMAESKRNTVNIAR